MAKLRIDITAPRAAFGKYAKDLTYSDTLFSLVDGEPVSTPNPQTAEQFLVEQIKSIVSDALAKKSVQTIEEVKRTEARTEGVAARIAIESAMTVSII